MSDIEQEFTQFYAKYPRHLGKLDALKAYRQTRKKVSHEMIMLALSLHVRRIDWLTRPQYVPYPASWLRAGMYEDELGPEMLAKARNGNSNSAPKTGCPKCPHDKHDGVCGYCRVISKRNGAPFGCSE